MLHDDLGQANEDTSVTKQVGMKRQVEIGWNRTVYLVGGLNPSEKYDFVSWDDEIPNWMEK